MITLRYITDIYQIRGLFVIEYATIVKKNSQKQLVFSCIFTLSKVEFLILLEQLSQSAGSDDFKN